MKKIVLVLCLAITSVVAIIACSKEDEPKPQEQTVNIDGGIIYHSQVVTIETPNISLTSEEYKATLGDISVDVSKTADDKLMFLVPATAKVGVQNLKIEGLNNFVKKYEVKQLVLNATPNEVVQPLFTTIDQFVQNLPSSPSDDLTSMKQNIANFKNYYNNKATDEEKKWIAETYKANKTAIDAVILEDFSNVKARLNYEERTNFLKFIAAVFLIDIGTQLSIKGGHPSVRALGILIAGISVTKSIEFYSRVIDKEMNEIGININGLFGQNNKNIQNTSLQLVSEQTANFAFQTQRRQLDASDLNTQNTLLKSFFSSRAIYNTIVTKVNNAIEFVNNSIPFISFSFMPIAKLTQSATPKLATANQEIFKGFKFSINHPNLNLESISLTSGGQLSLKVKITGTPASLPIDSFLNYTYSDEVSSFSGKIPLKVSKEFTLTGVTYGNKSDIDKVCASTFYHSCTYEFKFAFQGNSTPINGAILWKFSWDNDGNGSYEGSEKSYNSTNIDSYNSNANIVSTRIGCCWGNEKTRIRLEYVYRSPEGKMSTPAFIGIGR